MALEPKKISDLTQEQRNALIASLGCKTIHRMNLGDSLSEDFAPDELHIDTGVVSAESFSFTPPAGYIETMCIMISNNSLTLTIERSTPFEFTLNAGLRSAMSLIPLGSVVISADTDIYIYGGNEGDTVRINFIFTKSPF